MIKKIDHNKMGKSNLGWLQSHFHFSFADYYNPNNMNFGVLRVVNDDIIQPNTGFDTHPHQNMEIVSYVIDGELSHGDNMGNRNTIGRGHVQYMSAGTGVWHSEHNLGKQVGRLLQIWILPDQKGYKPSYGDYRFTWEDRINKWLPLVSGTEGKAPITIHQDVTISSLFLESNHEINLPVGEHRQAYLIQIEGSSAIGDETLSMRDAMEIIEEDQLIKATQDSHFLVIEMKKA